MFSVDDMYNPVMYQDIMNPSMGYMNPMCTMGMYPCTNLLGGTRMQPQLMQDKYETINKKDKQFKNNFISVLKALGWMTLGGFIPPARKYIQKSGGLGKAVGNILTNLWNGAKKIF